MPREQLYCEQKRGSGGRWKQRISFGGQSRRAGSNTWDPTRGTTRVLLRGPGGRQRKAVANGRKVKGAKPPGK
ncbi:Hypothetical predicted protein, partial [Pelobates cultripes]